MHMLAQKACQKVVGLEKGKRRQPVVHFLHSVGMHD